MHTARPKDLRFFNGTAVVSGGRGINNGEREGERSSVGPLLSVTHCLMLPRVEVTGCGHKAKCPLAVRPGPAVLAGPMG